MKNFGEIKTHLLVYLILMISGGQLVGQEKSSPTVFAELTYGPTFGDLKSGMVEGALKYQVGNYLITTSFSERFDADYERVKGWPSSLFYPVPYLQREESIDEFALMFGRRIIYFNTSISFSAGVSRNKWSHYTAVLLFE